MALRLVRQTHRRSQTLHAVLALGCLLIASATTAQQVPQGEGSERSRRPPWAWSAEERLTKRFDSAAMKAREARRNAIREQIEKRSPDLVADAGPSRNDVDSIHGDETPELFLPWELFDSLLGRGFSPEGLNPSETRREIEERAVVLGIGNDLWERLGKATSSLLSLQREQFQRAMRSPRPSERQESTGWTSEDLLYCKARFEAIEAAKAEFGEEIFLRLLYEAVAPVMNRAYVVDKGTAEHLLFIERGCR